MNVEEQMRGSNAKVRTRKNIRLIRTRMKVERGKINEKVPNENEKTRKNE